MTPDPATEWVHGGVCGLIAGCVGVDAMAGGCRGI